MTICRSVLFLYSRFQANRSGTATSVVSPITNASPTKITCVKNESLKIHLFCIRLDWQVDLADNGFQPAIASTNPAPPGPSQMMIPAQMQM
jgi:hypothetical protein